MINVVLVWVFTYSFRNERPDIPGRSSYIFQCNWTCHQRPLVFRDHSCMVHGVVFQDSFYWNCIRAIWLLMLLACTHTYSHIYMYLIAVHYSHCSRVHWASDFQRRWPDSLHQACSRIWVCWGSTRREEEHVVDQRGPTSARAPSGTDIPGRNGSRRRSAVWWLQNGFSITARWEVVRLIACSFSGQFHNYCLLYCKINCVW